MKVEKNESTLTATDAAIFDENVYNGLVPKDHHKEVKQKWYYEFGNMYAKTL